MPLPLAVSVAASIGGASVGAVLGLLKGRGKKTGSDSFACSSHESHLSNQLQSSLMTPRAERAEAWLQQVQRTEQTHDDIEKFRTNGTETETPVQRQIHPGSFYALQTGSGKLLRVIDEGDNGRYSMYADDRGSEGRRCSCAQSF